MSGTRRVRDWLSKLLLRGWLLKVWLRRKTKRLEHRYAHELIRASIQPPPEARPPNLRLSPPLQRLLLIADVMWEEAELVPELQKICHVQTLNLRPSLRASGNAEPLTRVVSSAVARFAATNAGYAPDVILLYARSKLLSEQLFDTLRQQWKSVLIGMNLDEKTEFLDYRVFSKASDNYQRWAKYFDLNLSNVRVVSDWYADQGLPVFYMAEGYHARFPEPVGDYRYEISFVGSRRPEREGFVRELRRFRVPVEVMGARWPASGSVKDPAEVYRASQINLGIGYASPSLVLTTLKARDFECPGAGACYLTTYNWELALHYEIGKEILCYRSIDELVEIFSFYRRRPQACFRIAQAAFKRCRHEHTWEKRFRDLFQKTGIA